MCGWPVVVRSGTGLTFLSRFVNFRILLVIKHTCTTVTKYLEFNPNREKYGGIFSCIMQAFYLKFKIKSDSVFIFYL